MGYLLSPRIFSFFNENEESRAYDISTGHVFELPIVYGPRFLQSRTVFYKLDKDTMLYELAFFNRRTNQFHFTRFPDKPKWVSEQN